MPPIPICFPTTLCTHTCQYLRDFLFSEDLWYVNHKLIDTYFVLFNVEMLLHVFKTNTSSFSLRVLEFYSNIPTCFELVKALHQGFVLFKKIVVNRVMLFQDSNMLLYDNYAQTQN